MIASDLLLTGKDLTRAQAKGLFRKFLKGSFDPETAKQVLVLLRKKGEHSNELSGLVDAVRSIEKPIRTNARFLVDGCGTGGDGKNTFNISTAACLVAAGAGAQVAKHGNKGISSRCGSSDLLEGLGVRIAVSPKRMLKAFKEANFGYFHAPLYHPVFKRAQPVRAELAKKRIRTVFNLAGPFLNPLRPQKQLIGVWNRNLLGMMAETARNLKLKHALIVWNEAGYDEFTTKDSTVVVELKGKKISSDKIVPTRFHLRPNTKHDLAGGNVKKNCAIVLRVLSGQDHSSKLDVVLLNAGAILYVSGKAKNIKEGIRLAQQSIFSESALRSLKRLVKISRDSR